MSRYAQSRIARQRGVTMIEVLVTVIVLSIGLLGLAAMHGVSLKNNHSAYMRSQASLLAYDIIDTMRADRERALSGAFNVAEADTPASDSPSAPWVQRIEAVLPSGLGMVDVNERMVTVTLAWDDTRGAGDQQRFEFRTQL